MARLKGPLADLFTPGRPPKQRGPLTLLSSGFGLSGKLFYGITLVGMVHANSVVQPSGGTSGLHRGIIGLVPSVPRALASKGN